MQDKSKIKKRVSFFSRILLVFNGIFILLMAAGFFAAYIPPDRYWIFAFAGLAFPYMVIVNLGFVLFWMAAGKKYLFLSLICLLFFWNRISGFVQFNRQKLPAENSGLIKVVSYNVRIFDRYNWTSNRIDKTGHEMLELMHRQQPDLLCIQEFHAGKKGVTNMEDSVSRATGLHFRRIEYARYRGKTRPYGIATFSRWPIINSSIVRYGNSHVNFCIFTDIAIGNDTVRLFNIHLESIQLSDEDYLYVSELSKTTTENKENFIKNSGKIFLKLKQAFITRAAQSREIAGQIRKSPYPVIVCGDFNDTPSSYSYRQMSMGLTDAFVHSGKGFGQTYAGIVPSFRIDYILYSAGLESTGFKRIHIPLSDHYPVSTLLSIPGKNNPE